MTTKSTQLHAIIAGLLPVIIRYRCANSFGPVLIYHASSTKLQ